MARVSTFKVVGLKDIEKQLSELKKATAKAVARRALKKAAVPIHDEAKALVPDDPKTGPQDFDLTTTLRIGTRATRGAKHRKQSPVEVLIGPRSRHAHLQEFGTSRHPATPFMRPAWDAKKQDALDIVVEAMWSEIEKTVKRQAAKTKGRG